MISFSCPLLCQSFSKRLLYFNAGEDCYKKDLKEAKKPGNIFSCASFLQCSATKASIAKNGVARFDLRTSQNGKLKHKASFQGLAAKLNEHYLHENNNEHK